MVETGWSKGSEIESEADEDCGEAESDALTHGLGDRKSVV